MTALLQSYLCVWLLVFGIVAGSMANLMVHTLTGGRWGDVVRGPFVAATRTMPLVAIAFVPVLAGVPLLFPWHDAPGRYLNTPFFIARSVAYLAVWVVLAGAFLRARTPRIAAAGLVVHALVVSLAAVDWIASLTPGWSSSGFGLVVATGQMLAAMALAVAVAAPRWRMPQGEAADGRMVLNDLGNLLLTYVLMWAYLAYTQFLVIWSENLPREIQWYVPRMQTSWANVGAFVIAFHFALPLLILLSRAAKRAPLVLAWLAGSLVAAHAVDVFWLVMPAFRPEGARLAWSDPVMLLMLGAGWTFAWRAALRREGVAREPSHA